MKSRHTSAKSSGSSPRQTGRRGEEEKGGADAAGAVRAAGVCRVAGRWRKGGWRAGGGVVPKNENLEQLRLSLRFMIHLQWDG